MDNQVDLESLPNGFYSQQPLLKKVHIRCNIENLPDDLFNGSTQIQNISLQLNRLTTLPENVFRSQYSLLNLDMSDNQLTTLPENLFYTTKSLRVLRLSKNNLRKIPEKLFAGLIQLTELYLDNNRLVTIDKAVFKSTNIQVLNMENNRLNFLSTEQEKDPREYSPFEYIKDLVWLNLRNNSITHYLSNLKIHNKNLKELDLSHNKITSLELTEIPSWNKLITVNLTHNDIKIISAKPHDYAIILNQTQQQARHEHPNTPSKWILNSNPIECDCKVVYFVKLLREHPSVELYWKLVTDDLYCTTPTQLKNRLVRDFKYEDLLCPLDSLMASHKYCPSKCNCMVRMINETVIFNCSNADLEKVPELPIIWSNDLPWTRKYELNIENNRIVGLPNGSESGYDRVVKFNARNNSLEHLSSENLPENLSELDISHNKLETLDGRILMRLKSTGLHMVLANNSWKCECGEDFTKYITLYSTRVDYDNITCEGGQAVREKSVVCPVDGRIIILACVLIALLGLFIGAVLALYYKYQQEVKVWLFARNLCLWFVTEEELDKDKKYDAFISFSHKDEDFVTEQLVPELETGPHPFKLCLHFRDWVVGEFIPNQITKSVEDSRRTIVVLSPNFIDSIWGRMEFRAAHQNALTEGRARLIVIIFGDIGDIEKLDPELKVYLKTTTYVKWGDPWFFDKLRYALPHPSI